eukprot:scaffold254822_cov139-Cyclotella_meneghiniana.AAC.1
MLECVEVGRRIAVRELATRLKFYKRIVGLDEKTETDVSDDLFSGLVACERLSVMKMVGAIIHPLFHNRRHMIAAGLCTGMQYDAGYEELLSRLVRYYESLNKNCNVAVAVASAERPTSNNQFSDEEDDNVLMVSESAKNAKDEMDKYETWKKSMFLPQLKPVKSLGVYDDLGHVRTPMLSLGPVIEKGAGLDLPSGKNHAKYIDAKGYYDIVAFFSDHKIHFPGLSTVVIGQFAPHITTEVDCESLFSQAGHLSHPNRSRTVAETFERL